MDIRDQQDLLCILAEARNFIVEARICGLANGGYSKNAGDIMAGAENIGVLDGNNLSLRFQKVF